MEKRVEDEDRVEENPLSEEMMNARRSTFADSWPHEHKKGWTCKIEKVGVPGNEPSSRRCANYLSR